MKKVIFLDSSYPINSRNERIIKVINKDHHVKVITWNRTKDTITNTDYQIFNRIAPYGSRFKKLKYMFQYYSFIKKEILSFKPEIVIASNWDMLFLASFIKKKFHFNLIYENRDMISTSNSLVKYSLEAIERISLKNVDSMILASRFFEDKYPCFKRKIIVLENKIPRFLPKYENTESVVFRISFIGAVRFFDILKNLLEATKDLSNVEIKIHGSGADNERLIKYVKDCNFPNVVITGQFNYNLIGELYANTDLVWSVYPNTENSNKKFVMPNKYFESIYFETPGIFPNSTKAGELVEEQNIGYTVNPYDKNEIKAKILHILNDRSDLSTKVSKMRNYKESIFFEDDSEKLKELISEG